MPSRWSVATRRRVATILAVVAIFVATIIASSRLLRLVFPDLDAIAYLGLFVACWVGAGGALVPIPGVRPISWFMIIQQAAALDPVIVALIGATAMTLGQTSYFLTARAAKRRGDAATGSDERPKPSDVGRVRTLEGDMPSAADPDPTSEPRGRRARTIDRARERVERQVREHGMATVLAVCALPTPLTTLTTTTAALSGMGYQRYVPASFAGFLILCSVLALFGQGLLLVIQAIIPRA